MSFGGKVLTIFHLDNSRSERIIWLAEELGLAYELQTFARENRAAPAALLDIHPIGTAPLLRDGARVIMESGAIVEYLVNCHGQGRLMEPVMSPHYIDYLQWLHFAEGTALSAMSRAFGMRMLLGAECPAVQNAMVRQQRTLQVVERELAVRPYFAGPRFTAADIMMEYYFTALERASMVDLHTYEHTTRWIAMVRSRPAYQRMMAVAAPTAAL
jgi:glutathione S-transferase